MSRVTLRFDSLTPLELRTVLIAFQTTGHMGMPSQSTMIPLVEVSGEAFNVSMPALSLDRAQEIFGLIASC